MQSQGALPSLTPAQSGLRQAVSEGSPRAPPPGLGTSCPHLPAPDLWLHVSPAVHPACWSSTDTDRWPPPRASPLPRELCLASGLPLHNHLEGGTVITPFRRGGNRNQRGLVIGPRSQLGCSEARSPAQIGTGSRACVPDPHPRWWSSRPDSSTPRPLPQFPIPERMPRSLGPQWDHV